jgi:hypothetical protein
MVIRRPHFPATNPGEIGRPLAGASTRDDEEMISDGFESTHG